MIIRSHYFYLANLFFTGLVLLLIAFILFYMYLRIKRGNKLLKWKPKADLLIRNAIFFEDDQGTGSGSIPVPSRTNKLIKNRYFRKILIQELVNAKKSVSGTSADNLVHLYKQLILHQYALTRLKDGKWHIKALAIQELSILGLKEHLTKIYRYTNHANELVRMEAQLAIVRLSGFEGLRFLDLISYPLSEWQQVKILHELSSVPPENFSGVEKWLRSSNSSVVTFALKLARIYHLFELHDNVSTCLKHPDSQVRFQAIITLGEIYNDQTAGFLIGRLLQVDTRQQIAIIQVLQNISSSEDIHILADQLGTENAAVKLAAARALGKMGAEGFESMLQHHQADQFPLREIIVQVKSELA
jgi:HEAT repeat protein